jgi:hypothetical protein
MFSINSAARFLAPSLAFLLFGACSVNVKDKSHGDGSARVDIKSPVGDLHVDEQPDIAQAGLSIYPGAKPAPKANSDDDKQANVNLSMPGFALKVVAAEFQSDDPKDKILAYYNKELQKYGKPVECHGNWTGGDANVEAGKKDGNKPVSCGNSKGNGDSTELKVGTENNQHIVAVKPEGKGSHFALVYVRVRTGSDNTI